MIQSYNLYRTLDSINIEILRAVFSSFSKKTEFSYTELLRISKNLGSSVSTIKARLTRMSSFGLISRSERSYRKSTMRLTDLGRSILERTNILDSERIKINNFFQFVFLKACSEHDNFTKKDIRKNTGFTKKKINQNLKTFQKKNGIILKESRMKMDIFSLSSMSKESLMLISRFEEILKEETKQSYPELSLSYLALLKFDFVLIYYILHEIEESKAGKAALSLENITKRLLIRKQKTLDLLRNCQPLKLVQIRPAERGDKLIYLTDTGLNFYRHFENINNNEDE